MPTPAAGGGAGELSFSTTTPYAQGRGSFRRPGRVILPGYVPQEPMPPIGVLPWRSVIQPYACRAHAVRAPKRGMVRLGRYIPQEPMPGIGLLPSWKIARQPPSANFHRTRLAPGHGWIPRYWPVPLPPFGALTLTEVFPPVVRYGQVFLSWASTSPGGTWYQVYINGALVWKGQRLWTWVPIPPGPVRVNVGTVPTGSETTSFASSLPAAPSRRASLSWTSGTYTGTDLAGFQVYGSDSPGGTIDLSKVLANITAYPAGIVTDGYGLGGYGSGGFGRSASNYAWTSGPLDTGSWSFAVRPYDSAGNLGTAVTTVVVIAAPPQEPAPFEGLTRLRYAISGYGGAGFGGGGYSDPLVTLTWNASPI
jgi:hypothetical protein